jgi:hypothetical protein
MWKNVYILKTRLKWYQNCEESQEELQLQLYPVYFFHFIFQILELCVFLKLYVV